MTFGATYAPELLLVVIASLIVLSIRAWRGVVPLAFAPRPNDLESARQYSADTERMRARLIASCVVFVLISIPHIFKLVPPNGIYGLRTALTLSNRAIWYPANAFMGWALIAASVLSGALLIRLPSTTHRYVFWMVLIAPIAVAIVASLVYVQQLAVK